MHRITTKFVKVFSLLPLYIFIYSTICFSKEFDFLDTEDQDIPILRRDIKIPVGIYGDTVHNFILEKGTLVSEIPSKVSQKRQEIGLSSHIPMEQRDTFLQDLSWQTTKDVTIKAPMSGRIINIFASKGQHVKKGDRLCTLGAMKMELSINSPSPGEIKHIAIKTNDFMYKNSVLFTLLPTSPKWVDINQMQIWENKDLLIPFFPWAISSPVEKFNTHADPFANLEQKNENRNEIGEEERNQPIQTLEEGNLSSLPIQNLSSEFVLISPKEIAYIEQNPFPLPIIQPGGSIPLTHNEQETELHNSPILNAPPTSEVSTLMPGSLNRVVEENNNALTLEDYPQILSLPLENPLMTLVTLTAPQVAVRKEHDVAFLLEPQQETSTLFTTNVQKIEQQNSPMLNAPPTSEVSTLMPGSLKIVVEENNNALIVEDSPQILSLPVDNPLMTLVTLTAPQVAVRKEQDVAFLLEPQQETSTLFSSNVQETEQQNSPALNEPPKREASILTSRTYPHSLKALILQNSNLSPRRNNEKNAKESKKRDSFLSSIKKDNFFLKKISEKEMCYPKSAGINAKKFLKEKLVNTSENKIDFSIFSWSNCLFILFFLGKLIILNKIITHRKPIYLRSKNLHACNFNNFIFINEKNASNINQIFWSSRQTA